MFRAHFYLWSLSLNDIVYFQPNPMNQAVRSIAQSNVAVAPPAAATAAANVRFNQTARNVMAQPQPPRAMVSPARLAVSEQVQPQPSVPTQQHQLQPQQQAQQEDEKKKEVEDGAPLDLTPEQLAYRQIVGEQLFAKIQVTHPTNTGKLTGMLLNLGPAYWEKMISSDEYLHQRVRCDVLPLLPQLVLLIWMLVCRLMSVSTSWKRRRRMSKLLALLSQRLRKLIVLRPFGLPTSLAISPSWFYRWLVLLCWLFYKWL